MYTKVRPPILTAVDLNSGPAGAGKPASVIDAPIPSKFIASSTGVSSSQTPLALSRRVPFSIHRKSLLTADRSRTSTRSIAYFLTAYRLYVAKNQKQPSHSWSANLTQSTFSAYFGEFLSDYLHIPPFISASAAQRFRGPEISQKLQTLASELQLFSADKKTTHIEKIKAIYRSLNLDLSVYNPQMFRLNLEDGIAPILSLLSRDEITLVSDSLRLVYLGRLLPRA